MLLPWLGALLQLFCRPAFAHSLFSDAHALVQQTVQQTVSPHNIGVCSPLPKPLHYDYGKYEGAYELMVDAWTDETFDRASVIGRKGAYEQLAPLMHKLQRGGTGRIVVFGGSSTAGAGCVQVFTNYSRFEDCVRRRQKGCTQYMKQKVLRKECSWPRRFQHWLQLAFPKGRVELTNFAQGAATSSSVLAGAALMLRAFRGEGTAENAGADLIFVDTLVNDVYQAQNTWFKEHRFRVDMGTNAAIAYEQLLRTLHALQPNAVIYPVLSGCKLCRSNGERHRQVIDHYNLPRLDFSDVVDSNQWVWSGPDGHPDYVAHQSIADVLAVLWGSVWKDTCHIKAVELAHSAWPTSFFQPQQLETFQPCLDPLSAYDASLPETAKDVKLGDGWRLFEDRPGKPGWISERPGSSIDFPLHFGRHPVLVVTWMRSYEKMGNATMMLNKRNYTLEGLWTEGLDEHVTLAHARWFQVDRPEIQRIPGEAGVAGFDIEPGTSLTMRIAIPLPSSSKKSQESQDYKMKILQVFSC